jgi:RNA polymerase sigma factor (TIGR02999 family)
VESVHCVDHAAFSLTARISTIMAQEHVTTILHAVERGEAGARERLMALVYEELRGMARSRLADEQPSTLQATALVHEASLRLLDDRVAWQGRGQFFAAAALAMRRILVDRARAKRTTKRGGGAAREELEADAIDPNSDPDMALDADIARVDLVKLDNALDKLAAMDPRLADVVHLRFFAGLNIEQVAEATGTSPRTVKRDWSFAKAWLHRELGE